MPRPPYILSGRTPRDDMWRSMRVMRTFTIRDVSATAEVSYTAAQKYVSALGRAGYLRRLGRKAGGRDLYWQLVRETGPRGPVRRRDGRVWDINARRYFGEDS